MRIQGPESERRLLSDSVDQESERSRWFALRGVSIALGLIRERFEKPSLRASGAEGDAGFGLLPGENILPYHNRHHTRSVIYRTVRILTVMQESEPHLVSDKDIALGAIAAAFHDTVQDAVAQSTDTGGIRRARKTGENEKASAQEAAAFMRLMNQEEGKEVFTEADIRRVEEAIMGTIPSFVRGTVIQPHVNGDSDIITHALAMADLGESGMGDIASDISDDDLSKGRRRPILHDSKLQGSCALFREENLDVGRALQDPMSLTIEQKDGYGMRMVNWLKGEIRFVEVREEMFEDEIRNLPEGMREAVRAEFFLFDRSRDVLVEAVSRLQTASFEEICRAFGYAI